MATAQNVKFFVITPERQVLEESSGSVVFTAHDGEMGVLTDRAPLMCELGIGQLRYEAGGQTRRLFIDGGFAQVIKNQVTILTQQAIPAEEVTPALIADEEQALAKLQGTDPDTQDARQRLQRRLSALRGLRSTR
ncbi:MAG: ATP synthase F1 subunit epsilon [Planctomycetota bacterium]